VIRADLGKREGLRLRHAAIASANPGFMKRCAGGPGLIFRIRSVSREPVRARHCRSERRGV